MSLRHSAVGAPWVMDIMVLLTEHNDEMRFNDIIAAIPKMPRTGLSWAIRQMLDAGLLEEREYQTSPRRVMYSLTLEGYEIGYRLQFIKTRLERKTINAL